MREINKYTRWKLIGETYLVTGSSDGLQHSTADKKTEVLYGIENAVGKGVEFMNAVMHRMDLCYDQNAPSIVVEVDAYRILLRLL